MNGLLFDESQCLMVPAPDYFFYAEENLPFLRFLLFGLWGLSAIARLRSEVLSLLHPRTARIFLA